MHYTALLWIGCILVGCQLGGGDHRLHQHLLEAYQIPAQRLPSAIVVLTEEGCSTCDRALADLVRTRTDVPSCLVVVRADGHSVDLNGFLEETENIRFDDDESFKALGLLQGSGLILLKGGKIDTVISLRSDGIREQVRFISAVLDTLGSHTRIP